MIKGGTHSVLTKATSWNDDKDEQRDAWEHEAERWPRRSAGNNTGAGAGYIGKCGGFEQYS